LAALKAVQVSTMIARRTGDSGPFRVFDVVFDALEIVLQNVAVVVPVAAVTGGWTIRGSAIVVVVDFGLGSMMIVVVIVIGLAAGSHGDCDCHRMLAASEIRLVVAAAVAVGQPNPSTRIYDAILLQSVAISSMMTQEEERFQ